MRHTATAKNPGKFRGCLIGGAAGDALGYTVEFEKERNIFKTYGKGGIQAYVPVQGLARISDDTQMTMFTANGLLNAQVQGKPAIEGIAQAYREWYLTQEYGWKKDQPYTCWLMECRDLYSRRAPGLTCLHAICDGMGSIAAPPNTSKGCGGVMRVAPIGLMEGDILQLDLLGAEAAALTHGHDLGYLPAALLVHIVHLAAFSEGISLKDIVLDGCKAMEELFPKAPHLPYFLELMERAVGLAETGTDDLTAIHLLGEGWVGEEALAIAVCCALKYQEDFDKAMIASVNHRGDSDSTGAITGNILGAWLGIDRIPEKYLQDLELKAELLTLADDLYELTGDAVRRYTP